MTIAVTRIIISCCNEEGFNFNFSEINLTTGDEIVQNVVNGNDSVVYSNLIVQIDFGYTKIAKMNFNSSFELYAFDCEPLYESGKKVTDISVVTLYDYNDQISKDNEVDVNYKVYGYDMGFDGTKETLQNILNKKYSREPDEIVYFKLKDKPTLNKYHRFAVNIIFDDNSSISDTTDLIYLYE